MTRKSLTRLSERHGEGSRAGLYAGLLALASWLIVLLPSRAFAHDLAMDQIQLMPDLHRGELRGQVTFNPHRTRALGDKITSETRSRVVSAVAASIRVVIDGHPLKLEFSVRELWVRAGPTVGDIVMLHARLPAQPRELRVEASPSMTSLIVTVQVMGSAGSPQSQSVLLQGGSASPPYPFDQLAAGWQVGGAGVFAPDNAESADEHGPETTTTGRPPASMNDTWNPARAHFEWMSVVSRMRQFFVLGFKHILPFGWDHLLFLAGLVFGSGSKIRRVVVQLTAFTAAHTVTLALGALGWVVLSPAIVEPAIALSIAYVAFENLVFEYNGTRRLVVAFSFGLLHGQGFASGLLSLGFARDGFLSSLVGFNLGVEAGQIVAVLAVCVLLGSLRKRALAFDVAVRQGSIAIGAIGLCVGLLRMFA